MNTSNEEEIKQQNAYSEINIEPGLRLVQLKATDADRLFELTERDREYLSQWLPWPKYTNSVDDSKEYIISTIQKRENREEYGYGIEVDGIIAGHISLMHMKDEREPEIGYWIASDYSGRGIVTKAVVGLTRLGLNELGYKKLSLYANPKNISSNKVAEKAGYIRNGRITHKGETFNVWEITKK